MTNQTINDILNRRSTRAFTDEKISEETMNTILNAGLHAPSAHNQQSWHFTVIYNKDLIDGINIETKKVLGNISDRRLNRISGNKDFHIFYNSPVAVIVSGEEAALMPLEDCSAATQNMLIAAESLGIGSCWIGFARYLFTGDKEEYYKEKLSIPEGYKPYFGIALGYKKPREMVSIKRREKTVNIIY